MIIANSIAIGSLFGRGTPEIGNIFSETSFASTSDFPISGTGITRGTNKLDMTGNPTLFSSYVRYDNSSSPHRYTGLEHWKQRVRCKTSSAINGTSYGIGIGVRSANTYQQWSTYVRWSWDTSGAGKIYLYNVDTISGQIVSGTSLVPTASTYYWIDVERVKNSVVTTIYSDSAGSIGSQLFTVTQTFSISSGSIVPHNVGQFTVQQFGGTANEITSWTVSSTARQNLDYCFIGDSNTFGLYAVTNDARWPEIASVSAGKTYTINAGISDRTADVILKLSEIIALSPQNVFISIGRNDVANSVLLSTIQTNIDTIISTLEAAGIVVKLGGVIASTVDVTDVQSHYTGKSNQKVNFFTDSKGAGTGLKAAYTSADNIHLNTTGHTGIATLAATIL